MPLAVDRDGAKGKAAIYFSLAAGPIVCRCWGQLYLCS